MSEHPVPANDNARRNVRLAVIHALVAVGFMAAFMWVQAHR